MAFAATSLADGYRGRRDDRHDASPTPAGCQPDVGRMPARRLPDAPPDARRTY